jgi:hypothetical protein
MKARRVTILIIIFLALGVAGAGIWALANYRIIWARHLAEKVASLDPTSGSRERAAWTKECARLAECGRAGDRALREAYLAEPDLERRWRLFMALARVRRGWDEGRSGPPGDPVAWEGEIGGLEVLTPDGEAVATLSRDPVTGEGRFVLTGAPGFIVQAHNGRTGDPGQHVIWIRGTVRVGRRDGTLVELAVDTAKGDKPPGLWCDGRGAIVWRTGTSGACLKDLHSTAWLRRLTKGEAAEKADPTPQSHGSSGP